MVVKIIEVLILDDDADWRDALGKIVSNKGYAPTECKYVNDAIELLTGRKNEGKNLPLGYLVDTGITEKEIPLFNKNSVQSNYCKRFDEYLMDISKEKPRNFALTSLYCSDEDDVDVKLARNLQVPILDKGNYRGLIEFLDGMKTIQGSAIE